MDVAAHLGQKRNDPSLRTWTGHIGKVHTDQAHLTEPHEWTRIRYRFLVDRNCRSAQIVRRIE
jgi:protein gp37